MNDETILEFLTPEKLEEMDIDSERWYELIDEILPMWHVDTIDRSAMFLAQCAHESRNFTVLEENLNYKASVLPKIWPRHFNEETAYMYGRTEDQPADQEMIANIAYKNRMGNGDVDSGDGWRFAGKGIIQLTGYNNHAAFADTMGMGIDEVVDYLFTDEGALQSACWFWYSNNLNEYADDHDNKGCTRAINGGYNGLEHREELYEKFMDILNES